jgi:hypothetical protein
MHTIIAVTNLREQQQMMSQLLDNLKVMYHTDNTISIAKISMSKIVVYHRVKDTRHIAASYDVLLLPVTMSYECLKGLPHTTNINISRVFKRLDDMKKELTQFVTTAKVKVNPTQKNVELKMALRRMFDKEIDDAEC